MLKKNIISNYAGQLYTMIIGLLVLPLYLHYLGAEAYGLVGFFGLMQLWVGLFDLGFSSALSKEVATIRSSFTPASKIALTHLLHSLECIALVMAFVVIMGMGFGSAWIAQQWLHVGVLEMQSVVYCIVLMGINLGLRFLWLLYSNAIMGAEAQTWLNGANAIFTTARFIGVLPILHFWHGDVELFFEYQLVVTVVSLAVFGHQFYQILDIGRFKLYFSYHALQPILPFALSIAYIGAIWVFLTQFDKLLLSHILTLKEYGYLSLVVAISNAVSQLINPITQALQPRMVSLVQQENRVEMFKIYKKATQFMAIFIFSMVGIIATFSYELLYAWTGDSDMALWSKEILFWYIFGNGILSMSTFQYTLQFAHGNLRMHVRFNTVLALIALPSLVWVIYSFGALGAAFLIFCLRLIGFLFWVPVVHHTFAPTLHKDWMLGDILPIACSSGVYLWGIQHIGMSFDGSRIENFGLLVLLGCGMLCVNTMVSREGRAMVFHYVRQKLAS